MGLERPAPPPTLCAQAYTPLGTPQGLRDLLPLTTPTQRTPEKTQTASMRRTPGLLRSMFDFAQQSAGNLWQLRERASMHQDSVSSPESDSKYDVQTSPQGWQTQLPQALFATPMAKQSAGDHLACKISTNTVQMASECRGLTSTMAGMVHVPLLGMHMDKTPSQAPWTSGPSRLPCVCHCRCPWRNPISKRHTSPYLLVF